MVALIKHLHMSFALLSFAGFFLRGVWMLRGSALLEHKATRVLPHINDTLLLATAIALLFLLGYQPLAHPWLVAKILALVVYIGLGVAAFRHRRRAGRFAAWLAAMLVFAYIVSVALSRHPLGPLVLFG